MSKARLSDHHHRERLNRMVNPEHRVAYYRQHIDTEAIDLSTAENILLLSFYQKNAFRPEHVGEVGEIEVRYPKENMYGSSAYRKSIATLLTEKWGIEGIDEDCVYAVAGVSAALECLAFTLFARGDSVITPAPLWYGFPWSYQRPGLKFRSFHLADSENFELTLEDVQKAYNATKPGPKLLILTNPNNPLGINYSPELLEEIYDWVLNNTNMHIISDEIYAFSQVNVPTDKEPFRSALTLDAVRRAGSEGEKRVHVVWGLAKDFGLSGFKVGFVVSKSEQVRETMIGTGELHTMTWFSPFDSLKQYMLKTLFLDRFGAADPRLAVQAMEKYAGNSDKSLLAKQYYATKECLDKNGIKYVGEPNAAIFFLLDLREYLGKVPLGSWTKERLHSTENTQEGELNGYIRENAKVLLIPGLECFSKEEGYFRLCYTAQKRKKVKFGIDRLGEELAKLR